MDLTPRLAVAELDLWGRLVKSWATHLDYISQGYPDQPPRNFSVRGYPMPPPPHATTPDTGQPWVLPPMQSVNVPTGTGSVALPAAVAMPVAQFSALVAAAGVHITSMPAQYTHVVIVQGDESTMVLRLPPKDTLQGSEDDLLNNAQLYPMPDFYGELYPGATYTPPKAHDAIMELHAYRIGEYTLNNCN